MDRASEISPALRLCSFILPLLAVPASIIAAHVDELKSHRHISLLQRYSRFPESKTKEHIVVKLKRALVRNSEPGL